MNNDLISREALKKAIEEYKYCGFYDKLIEIIDDAPAVEPEKAKDSEIIKAYTKGFDTGVETVKNERLPGEWKITDGYPHKVYCDKCYKTYAQENWEVWKDGSLPRNFCPNCGADMRKGGVE